MDRRLVSVCGGSNHPTYSLGGQLWIAEEDEVVRVRRYHQRSVFPPLELLRKERDLVRLEGTRPLRGHGGRSPAVLRRSAAPRRAPRGVGTELPRAAVRRDSLRERSGLEATR